MSRHSPSPSRRMRPGSASLRHGVVLDEHGELQARLEDSRDDRPQRHGSNPWPRCGRSPLRSRHMFLDVSESPQALAAQSTGNRAPIRLCAVHRSPATSGGPRAEKSLPPGRSSSATVLAHSAECQVTSTAHRRQYIRSRTHRRRQQARCRRPLDEGDIGAGVGGYATGGRDRFRREVQTSHGGAEAVQGDRVGADVALQMNSALAVDVAEPG